MLQAMPVKKAESTKSREKYEGPRTNQLTKVRIQTCLTRDFSTSTREIYHGSNRPYPHEARTSRVTGSVAGRLGSGQQAFFQKLAGRVGSAQEVFKISRIESGRVKRFLNLAGGVGSDQDVWKFSRIGLVRVETSRNSRGSGRVS